MLVLAGLVKLHHAMVRVLQVCSGDWVRVAADSTAGETA